MAIMDEVNRATDTSKYGVGEATYVGTIPTAGTKVIDELTGGELGSTAKRLKIFAAPGIEIISDPVMAKFISKIQAHLNHIAQIIVGDQASISVLNSKIGDVPEYDKTI